MERLVLLSILPKEGDFTNLKIIRKLRESLSFSEEENKKLNFKQGAGGIINWDANFEKDIHTGEKANDVIVEALKALNDQKKLTNDHYSLYEKFVETTE